MTNPNRLVQPDTLVNQATLTGTLAASDFSPGMIVAGRFKIVRLLGMGGMGLVYQAHDTELDIDVALKLLRPELASRRDAFERFRQELLLARQVSSPHVVRIHDLVKHDNAWLISMDYVAGQSLERLLDQSGPLPTEQAITIVRQLALGLSAAHRSGVVHRDLKPANVLVNEQGEASITDFGVARSAGNTGITDSGVIIGTPAYLSPEQARAEPLDGRSDLYALGLILYEMLTGTLPFRGGTPAEMMVQRIVRDPPSVATVKPDLPAFAVRLCTHLLELKPAHRFQTSDEVVAAIDARRVPGSTRQQRKSLGVVAALLLAAAGGLGWLQWRAAQQPAATEAASTTPAVQLGIAALPLTVDSPDPSDQDLSLGIHQWLNTALTQNRDLFSADALRVSRLLTELGFDAAAAQRQRARVFEVSGARRLLDGQFQRLPDGHVDVKLALWEPGREQAIWTATSATVVPADLPEALLKLQLNLMQKLGISAELPAWPKPEVLLTLGRLQSAAPATDSVAALTELATDTQQGELWWSLMQSLDRAGRASEASTVARQATDSLSAATAVPEKRAQAYAFSLLGNEDEALTLLQALTSSVPNDQPLLLLQARVRADLGLFDDAMADLTRLVADDQRNVDAWYLLGKSSIQSGDAKRAVDDYLVRAQVLANRLDDPRMQADVGNALGIGYRSLGQLSAAAERFQASADMRGKLGDRRGQAASLRNLANVLSIQGEYAQANSTLTQAKTLIEPLGDPVAMADLANDVGMLAEEQGDYRNALASYRDALRLRQAQGDQREIGQSQINVGFAYFQLGEFDNAQTYWQQSMATYAQADDRIGIVHAREGLALAEIARGDWAQARESFEHILIESESLQMAEERSIAQAGLAELERLQGNMISALELSSQALAAFEQRGDIRGMVEMRLLQSTVYSDLGDWDQASARLAELPQDQVEAGEQASLHDWRLGEVALGRGQLDSALAAADSAIASAASGRNLGYELGARLLRTRVLLRINQPAAAAQELSLVESQLTRYASVPYRLLLAETQLQVAVGGAANTYREVRAQLARVPAYGRAFQIHARAAAGLSGNAAQEASTLALGTLESLQKQTPAAQHQALSTLAASLAIVPQPQAEP